MRVHETEGIGALFAGDGDGGCIIACESCDHEGISTEQCGEPYICDGCDQEIFYRPWCEW